jgi:hypothetical protein
MGGGMSLMDDLAPMNGGGGGGGGGGDSSALAGTSSVICLTLARCG